MNIFSVVRFPNKACAGSSYNGTCYTTSECSTRGGSSSGTCAGGYGVCCICKCNLIYDGWLGITYQLPTPYIV